MINTSNLKRCTTAWATLMMLNPVLSWAQDSTTPAAPLPSVQQAVSNSDTGSDDEPVFSIAGFEVQGPELVPRNQVMAVLAGFSGRPITFSELRTATAAVERLHALAGFEVVRVLIPEQDVEPGQRLKLQIVDARLDVVQVSGNDFLPAERVAASLPVLKQGALINTVDMDKNLRLVNDNPSRIVRVELEPSDKPGLVDAKVKVSDQSPLAAYVSLDNSGTNATGDFRLGVSLQHNNFLNRDHMASLQYVTSPGHWSDVEVYGLNYKIPFYELNSMLEVAYSDSNVNAGSLSLGASSISVQGAGTSYAVRWTYLMDRLAGFDQRVTVSQELKQFVSQVQLNGSGSSLVPNLESRPTGVSYSLTEAQDTRTRSAQIAYFKNYVTGGDNSTVRYSQSNSAARADFDVFRMSLAWSDQWLGNWRFTAQVDGQYSGNALISGEQFGAGGMYSVRGFEERVLSGDSGLRESIELQGPNLAKSFGGVFERFMPVVFTEAAQVRLHNAASGSPSEPHLMSYGIGARFAFAPRQQFRVDLARVVSGVPIQPQGDVMLHVSFATAL
ncbi:hypothetical protein NQT62_07530 [Limnobacter humi]|uniref:ShlB/FhaC/HecB family hemolysin secretion/activation protein n=1 Tax=Limnobacter humi TaxID=1778671 RepID=A0ABT1WFN7_9BURK|nr:ShlB/FhaC/HecB family hemolysin secretion/activation protein [Limnobacter humi]MCQ8896285.1 hypothetical protein [Limnobacter humi]